MTDANDAPRIICPVHGIPDCSPLLNGCSIPNFIRRWWDEVASGWVAEANRAQSQRGVAFTGPIHRTSLAKIAYEAQRRRARP